MKQSIKHLIYKFIRNECNPEEVDVLVEYFQNNEIDNAFPEVEDVLEMLKEQDELSEKDSQKIYKSILKKSEIKRLNLRKKRRNKKKKYVTLAAVFVCIIGVGFYFGLLKMELTPSFEVAVSKPTEEAIQLKMADGKIKTLSKNKQLQLRNITGEVIGIQKGNSLVYKKNDQATNRLKYNTLIVPYGRQFKLELADGSQVTMNAGSSLKYPVNFPEEGEREVFLTGEAFFDITKDKAHPFIVNAKKIKVEVLGTEFNISAYPEDQSSRVVLINGSVSLSSNIENVKAKKINPGELAQYAQAEKEFKVQEVNTKLYTAWMAGGLVFRNESFENILKKMERHYNVTIINKEPDKTKEKFNASFGNEPLEKILEYFKKTYEFDFIKKNKDTFIIGPTIK